MQWFRWHHGTVTDPKWRVIAKRANTSVATVLAIWAVLLEIASMAETRGDVSAFCAEDVAEALDISSDCVTCVTDAMQGKVIANQQLTAWEKRQPKREDDSTDRVKRYRQRVTRGNARKRSVTHGNARGEEIREEKKTTKRTKGASRGALPWMGDVRTVLKSHYGGEPQGKYWAVPLTSVVERLGIDLVASELDAYCAVTQKQYLNPSKFAEFCGTWGVAASPLTPEAEKLWLLCKRTGIHHATKDTIEGDMTRLIESGEVTDPERFRNTLKKLDLRYLRTVQKDADAVKSITERLAA